MQSEVISNARNRILSLLDDGSFIEIDGLVEKSVIIGYGTVSLRPVCVFSQDSSVMSGALTLRNCEKICKIIDVAVKTGVPIIGFYDSMGAKIDEGTEVFVGIQKILSKLSSASGVIPQIAVVSGTVGGISTFAVSFSDFVFMIENTSKMFMCGPQALTAVTGDDVSAESYGGAKSHFNGTGICQFSCSSDDDCNDKIKELLKFLPDNNLSDAEIIETDDIDKKCDDLLFEDVDVYSVINSVCDVNSFLEVSSGFAGNIITGFCRIGGRVCGIVANNSRCNDGKINIDASKKAFKFVRFCDAFNISIVTLIDNDGFEVSLNEELNGIVKQASNLLFAYSDATVPKINIIFKKAFGGANLMMGTAADMVLAWESAKISVVNPQGAVNVLFNKDIADSESPVSFREEKLKEYLETEAAASNASGFIDAVINPSDTRQRIINALDMFSSKREVKSIRKHESFSF